MYNPETDGGFEDRAAAGRLLAKSLSRDHFEPNAIVLGLPRGGVPVAFEVARQLHLPLEVLIVRKLGTPSQPELAMGAIASGGIVVLEPSIIRMTGVSEQALEEVVARESMEVQHRERLYGCTAAGSLLKGRTVILVDDGIATGATARAAVKAARSAGASRVVVAAPVASREAVKMLRREADEVVSLMVPAVFRAVGEWYRDFPQVSDQSVRGLLSAARSSLERRHETPAA